MSKSESVKPKLTWTRLVSGSELLEHVRLWSWLTQGESGLLCQTVIRQTASPELDLISCLLSLILCRLVYWVSLNVCSSWRGFGSGLTVFPLLAMVALNLFLMYMNLKEPLFGSQDVLYNQVTPSSWSEETSQSPSGKPGILPTDILDSQWRRRAALSSSRGGDLSKNRPFLWSAVQHSYTRCHYNFQVCDGLTCIFFPIQDCLF